MTSEAEGRDAAIMGVWWLKEHSALEAAQKAERVQLAAVHAAAARELVEGEGEGGDMKPTQDARRPGASRGRVP